MAAVRHLGILKLKFLKANNFSDTFYVITLNFVEIGRTVADISDFFRVSQIKCKNSRNDRA